MDLTLIPSMKCNLRCEHCFNDNPSNELMSLETSNNVIKFMKDIRTEDFIDLTFTGGGEPFLAFDSMENILTKFGVENLYGILFKSNGVFLNDNKQLEWLNNLFHTCYDLGYIYPKLNISDSIYHRLSRSDVFNKKISNFRKSQELVDGDDILSDLENPMSGFKPLTFTWDDNAKPYAWGRAKNLKESIDTINCCPLIYIVSEEYENSHTCLTIIPNGDIGIYCSIRFIKLGNVNDIYIKYTCVRDDYLKIVHKLRNELGMSRYTEKLCISKDCNKCMGISTNLIEMNLFK